MNKRLPSNINVQQIGLEELDRFQQRIVQIYLDAFTTGDFAFLAPVENENKTVRYLRRMLENGSVAFFAYDSGEIAHPDYPIGFLFGSPLSTDRLLDQTPIRDDFDVGRSGFIAELAVDRGHRGRRVGHSLIEVYLGYCRDHRLLDVFTRTNDADSHLHRFYCTNGFSKMGVTARQKIDTPQPSFVTKRYFRQVLQ